MASSINASTTAGVVTTADTSGVLNIQTAGTTAITVDASQNVGVGVTPAAWSLSGLSAIQIKSASLAGFSSALYLNNNVYYNGGWKFIGSGYGVQYTQDNSGGQHIWNISTASGTAGNAITFTQAMTLNANGVLALQGASTSANGVGITFPATQSASSDANTLDDYEEGTWTPVLSDAATGGNNAASYAGVEGWYTKIGNAVTIAGRIVFPVTTGMTGANEAFIKGIPFTTSRQGYGSVYLRGITFSSGRTYAQSFLLNNCFQLSTQGSAVSELYTTVSQVASGTAIIYFSMTYNIN
jgi:hypothetical protein